MERLIKIIKDLKQNRRLSSESESIISPFIGKTYESTFSFLEASSSFASGLSDEFKGGKTVLAEITDFGLDCSILFPKSMNDWIDGLKEGDDLEVGVRVLKFDNLYQRVVFEQYLEYILPKEKPEEYPGSITDSTKTGLIGKRKVESSDEEVIETESLAENFAATESRADSLTLIHPGSKTDPVSSNHGDANPGEELKIKEFIEQVIRSPEPVIIEQDLKNESDSSEIQNQQDEVELPVETRESFPDANEFEIWKSKYLAGDPVRKYFSEEQIIQTFRKTHNRENSLTSFNHQVIAHSDSVPTEKSTGLKTSKNSYSDEANEFEIWKSKYLAGDPVREHFSEEQIIQTFSKIHSQETSLVISNNYKLKKQNELKNSLIRSIKRYPFFVIFAAILVAVGSPDPSSVGILKTLGIGSLFFLMVGGWREKGWEGG